MYGIVADGIKRSVGVADANDVVRVAAAGVIAALVVAGLFYGRNFLV
jgi:hypothetical protein